MGLQDCLVCLAIFCLDKSQTKSQGEPCAPADTCSHGADFTVLGHGSSCCQKDVQVHLNGPRGGRLGREPMQGPPLKPPHQARAKVLPLLCPHEGVKRATAAGSFLGGYRRPSPCAPQGVRECTHAHVSFCPCLCLRFVLKEKPD